METATNTMSYGKGLWGEGDRKRTKKGEGYTTMWIFGVEELYWRLHITAIPTRQQRAPETPTIKKILSLIPKLIKTIQPTNKTANTADGMIRYITSFILHQKHNTR
jgi:hypothetical protein